MINILQHVFAIISAYNGVGLYLTIYLLALMYLFLSEKDKGRRIIFCYIAAVVFGLIFFPVTAYLIMYKVMDEEIFYRQIWLIPCGVTVCYAGIRLLMRVGENKTPKLKAVLKSVVAVLMLAVIVLMGQFTFRAENYQKSENEYHLPQYVIDVCDTIKLVGSDYNFGAAFPASMVQFTRQYMAGMHTPYGREAIVEKYRNDWNAGNVLLDLIEADSYDADTICPEAAAQGVEVFVVYGFKEFKGNPEEYGYSYYKSVDGYDIYSVFWIQDFFHG